MASKNVRALSFEINKDENDNSIYFISISGTIDMRDGLSEPLEPDGKNWVHDNHSDWVTCKLNLKKVEPGRKDCSKNISYDSTYKFHDYVCSFSLNDVDYIEKSRFQPEGFRWDLKNARLDADGVGDALL